MELSTVRLRAVLAVAETGSFSEAARRMHMAQPSMSRAVSELEKLLGVVIFARGTHSATVTPQGRAIIAECERLLSANQDFWSRAHRAAAGELIHLDILAMHSLAALVLPRALRTFRETYPHVGLTVSDSFAGEILDSVTDDERKIAFTAVPPNFRGFADDASVRYTELMVDEFVLVQKQTAGPAPVLTWDEVSDLEMIVAAPNSNTGRYTAHIFESRGIAPTVIARLRNISSVGGMVAAGVGAAIVPRSSLPLMAFADLRISVLPDPYQRSIGVIRSKLSAESAVHELLISAIRRECGTFAEAFLGNVPRTLNE